MLVVDGVRKGPAAVLEGRIRLTGVNAHRDDFRLTGEIADPRLGHGELVDGTRTRAAVARPPAIESGRTGLVIGPSGMGRVPEIGEFEVIHTVDGTPRLSHNPVRRCVSGNSARWGGTSNRVSITQSTPDSRSRRGTTSDRRVIGIVNTPGVSRADNREAMKGPS